MAKRVESVLVDDYDGSEPAETVSFAVDGTEYEIDLAEINRKDFYAKWAEYIKYARRVGGPRRRSPNRRVHLQAAREWLRQNGHEIGDRGRVPQDKLKLFEAAQKVSS